MNILPLSKPVPGLYNSIRRILLPRTLPLWFGLIFLTGAHCLHAQEATDSVRIEGIRATLQQVESTLERKNLNDVELLNLRGRVEPLIDELKIHIAKQSTKLEALKSRFEQLVPKDTPKTDKPDLKQDNVSDKNPADTTVQVPSIDTGSDATKDRIDQEKILQEKQIKDLDSNLRVARYEAEHGQQILATISERRRVLFAQTLLDHNQSIISPRLWLNIARMLPGEIRFLTKFFIDSLETAKQNLTLTKALILMIFILGLVVFAPKLSLYLARFEGQLDNDIKPSRLTKASTAFRVMLGRTLVPGFVCIASFLILQSLDLMDAKAKHIVRTLLLGIAFLFFIRAISRSILPLDLSNWRVFGGSDTLAVKLQWLSYAVGLTLVLGKVFEALFITIAAPLIIVNAIKGMISVMIALIVMQALRGSFTAQTRAAGDEAYPDPDPYSGPNAAVLRDPQNANWVRIAGWGFCLGILISASAGYITLASFLSYQIAWVAIVFVLLGLILIVVDEFFGKTMSSDGLMGRRIGYSIGLKSGSIDQISILSSGLMRIAAFLIALFLVLAPWGVDSGDLTGYLKAAFFGFQVAGVTISFSTIATAIVIFIAGVTITRAIQRWLELKYLPFTGLDIGLRNSIKTIFGYIGIFIACALSFSAAGLSLDKLTIVAGALSVGIGFGLQSIVNNFVSGLILLWERPLRVGDLIAVGGEEGIVKRINVRATEIETFDKASLIVPNSEFISGRVKNWVHSSRYARITIPISVKNTTDPKKIEALLKEVALAHREVLSQPASKVFFIKITDTSLDFELRCFADVDVMATTKSELLFAVYERLQIHEIEMPASTQTVGAEDMKRLGSAIASHLSNGDSLVKASQSKTL